MEHTILETVPLAICNRSNKRKAKKRKKSISNSNPEDISLQKKSCFEGGLSQSPPTDANAKADAEVSLPQRKENDKACSIRTDDTNAVGNNDISCASEDRKSDIVCQSLKTEATPSTIGNQSQNHEAKKRKKSRKRKKSISNAGSNCEADDFSSQEKSHHGGDLSLSAATVMCNQAVAEVSVPQRKDCDKSGSSQLGREAADGIVSDHSNVVSHHIETAPSTICDQSKEHKVKRRRKGRNPKNISDSILNADSNCDPDGISSQKRSYSGGDVSQPSAGGTHIQADAEVSQLQLKENDKARSSHLDREAINGLVSDHSNNAVTQSIETASSTTCDQNKEHKAKKRKKRRKSKKNNDSIANIDSNCDPDRVSSQKTSWFGEDVSLSSAGAAHTQADLEVSQLQLKENDKAGSSHVDGGTANGIVSDHSINVISQNIETAPSTICDQNKELKAKKRKKRKKSKKNNDSIINANSNYDPDGISSRDNFSSVCPCLLDQSDVNSELSNVKLPSLVVKAAGQSSRKLLILDLNGLLADIRFAAVEGYKPKKYIARRAVYKRPFCDDFLEFCFETFDVGVWSSRKWKSMESMTQFLMKDKRKRLLFCWNQLHCTKTRYQTIENEAKPIFLKELQKLWDKDIGDRRWNWEKGFYNESNTLLIDDSPYKALRNPPYTGIFPNSYECTNFKDNSLGPNGELRLYLERLAAAENVQEFVKENPIGQSPITNAHPSWDFYSKILDFSSDIGGRRKVKKSVLKNVEQQKGGLITRPQAKEMKPVLVASPAIQQEDLLSRPKKRRWRKKVRSGEPSDNANVKSPD